MTAYRTRSLEEQVANRPFVRLVDKPVDYDEIHVFLHALEGFETSVL